MNAHIKQISDSQLLLFYTNLHKFRIKHWTSRLDQIRDARGFTSTLGFYRAVFNDFVVEFGGEADWYKLIVFLECPTCLSLEFWLNVRETIWDTYLDFDHMLIETQCREHLNCLVRAYKEIEELAKKSVTKLRQREYHLKKKAASSS